MAGSPSKIFLRLPQTGDKLLRGDPARSRTTTRPRLMSAAIDGGAVSVIGASGAVFLPPMAVMFITASVPCLLRNCRRSLATLPVTGRRRSRSCARSRAKPSTRRAISRSDHFDHSCVVESFADSAPLVIPCAAKTVPRVGFGESNNAVRRSPRRTSQRIVFRLASLAASKRRKPSTEQYSAIDIGRHQPAEIHHRSVIRSQYSAICRGPSERGD